MAKDRQKQLTARQRAAFWEAHRAACIELGFDTREEREAYRRVVMREACGKMHLAELNRTHDFDRVMSRFAKDAGDWQMAEKFAVADEARQMMLVRICCAQLMQLKGAPAGSTAASDYLAGVVEQARIPCGRDVADSSFWMDCNPSHLKTLFQILDTHRRRLLRELLDGRTARAFLSFDPVAVYTPRPDGGLRVTYDAQAYADIATSIRINMREVA